MAAAITTSVGAHRGPDDAFVGRDAELQTLFSWWHEGRAGREPRLALLAGESGVGKTGLVEAFVAELADDAPVVLRGPSFGTSFLAYEPWVAALRGLLGGSPTDVARAAIGADAAALTRLPWLADLVPAPRAPSAAIGTPTEEAVADLVHGMLVRAASVAPLLVVLDDVHWADRGSVELLRRLLAMPGDAGYLVLAVERRPSANRGAWHAALDGGVVAPSWTLVLGQLDESACASLLQQIAPHAATPEVAAALFASSNGNVFIARELATYAAQLRGRADDLAQSLPETASTLWLARLEPLSRVARRALGAAAVVGTEFDVELLDQVASNGDSVIPALGEGVAAGLIEPITAGRYRFGHGMLRDHLHEELPAVRRQRLHRRVAQAIERDERTTALSEPTITYHYLQAGAAFRSETVVHAIAAARWSFTQGTLDTARDLAEVALDVLGAMEAEPAADRPECAHHRVELGDILVLLGHDASREVLLGAVDHFEAVDDVASLSRCASILLRPGDSSVFGELDPVMEFVERLLPRLDGVDDALAARVLVRFVAAIDYRGEAERQRVLSERALAAARSAGDPTTLAMVLGGNRPGCEPDRIDEWLATAHELTELGRHHGDLEHLFRGLMWAHNWEIDRGEVDAAARALEEAERIAAGVPYGQLARVYNGDLRRNMEAALALRRVTQDLLWADYEAVERDLDEVNRWAGDPSQSSGRLATVAMVQYGILADDRGQLADLADAVEAAVANTRELAARWQLFAALIDTECDRPAAAARRYGPIIERRLADIDTDSLLVTLLIVAARVAFALGDVDGAAILVERLRPYSGRTGCGMFVCLGPVDWALGMCAAVLGRLDEAESWYASAFALCRRLRSPSFEARVELARAQTRARLGAPDVLGPAGRARALAADLGMARVEECASALLT